jgi:N-acetylneuraminate synthase/N,N'-diacetyllegionaminate synthase|tara:strand:- start:504 stop:1535 length:1032 start_codon:yes stop_codon:yes gene_type:complete
MNKSFFHQKFSINEREIGKGCPVFLIAEAGVAHFGSLEKAKQLVDLAVAARADAVKFQIFKTDELVAIECEEWQNRLRSKEIPFESFRDIQTYCNEKGILFLATAHDEPSLEFLETIDVPAYKIGSGEVKNWAFIEKIASRKKPVFLSTGMFTLDEVGVALGYIRKAGNSDVAVLHCVTSYPTLPTDVNLRAMDTIRDTYGTIVGYSDHTQGSHFALAAVARDACVIEKHITMDFNIPDAQDWKVSCGPGDFPIMVKQIREIEAGLGTGMKAPCKDELLSLEWARKSLVATADIMQGDVITTEKLCAKRPGIGIEPAEMGKIVGKRAKVNIEAGTLIRWEQLN